MTYYNVNFQSSQNSVVPFCQIFEAVMYVFGLDLLRNTSDD